jgi:hypothetical protein
LAGESPPQTQLVAAPSYRHHLLILATAIGGLVTAIVTASPTEVAAMQHGHHYARHPSARGCEDITAKQIGDWLKQEFFANRICSR